MKTNFLLLGALALMQATSLSGNAINSDVEMQEASVGFSIEVGPGYDPYYYGPYDGCYGPGGVYLGPGCPRYYYGPGIYYRDYGRHHGGHYRGHHGGGRHHGGRHRR